MGGNELDVVSNTKSEAMRFRVEFKFTSSHRAIDGLQELMLILAHQQKAQAIKGASNHALKCLLAD